MEPGKESGMSEQQPWNVDFPLPQRGDYVGVKMPDGTVRVEIYGMPRVDQIKRAQENLRKIHKSINKLTKPSLWQRIRRWLLQR